MIEEPGSFSRDDQLGQARARTAGQQPDIVGDLVERAGQRAQRAGQVDDGVVRALHHELVGRRDEGQAGQPRDLLRARLGKARLRVDAGADRGAAEGQTVHTLQRVVEALQVVAQHARIARPFLPERDRDGILHMGAPDLDDVLPRLRLRGDAVPQLGDGGRQPLPDRDRGGHVHRRREGVVRRLGHVDVVIGMHGILAPERLTGDLAGPVRDHLVDVHVELGAATRHPDVQRKHLRVLSGQNLVADLNDELVLRLAEAAIREVDVGGGLFQDRVARHELTRHPLDPDVEILDRPLRLGAPQLVAGDLHLTHAVLLDAEALAAIRRRNPGGLHAGFAGLRGRHLRDCRTGRQADRREQSGLEDVPALHGAVPFLALATDVPRRTGDHGPSGRGPHAILRRGARDQ
ncbi:hypothetical protein M2437_005273 [Methylorubrum pseudosasae]|nr:hypothetical protein [Methylorubrum pseudosasae]